MNKYITEGNINFFDELYKSLDVEDNEHKTEEDNNLCLISNQPLTDKFVQIGCGHKFNYIQLYLDVKNHKQNFNLMESNSCRLNIDEIRCPYCRKKQKGLLPYYEELGLKDHGVNYIDPAVKLPYYMCQQNMKKCEYLTLNPDYIANPTDTSGNNTSGNNASGNNPTDNDITNEKYIPCYMMGSQINYAPQSFLQASDYGDTKCYCWDHKKLMIKKYKQAIKDKQNELYKEKKLKEKEDKQKQKEEKQKEKEEKQKEKKQEKEAKKMMSKNVILGPSVINVETTTTENAECEGCIVILKSGANKGTKCGLKVASENMCKRHLSFYKKK